MRNLPRKVPAAPPSHHPSTSARRKPQRPIEAPLIVSAFLHNTTHLVHAMPFAKDDLERVYYGQEADALDTAATVLGPHAAGYGVQVGMQPLHSTTKGAPCTFNAHITNDKKPNMVKSLTNFLQAPLPAIL